MLEKWKRNFPDTRIKVIILESDMEEIFSNSPIKCWMWHKEEYTHESRQGNTNYYLFLVAGPLPIRQTENPLVVSAFVKKFPSSEKELLMSIIEGENNSCLFKCSAIHYQGCISCERYIHLFLLCSINSICFW